MNFNQGSRATANPIFRLPKDAETKKIYAKFTRKQIIFMIEALKKKNFQISQSEFNKILIFLLNFNIVFILILIDGIVN